ncbi:YdcF family protein [Thiohalocapsa sp. ML1]|jgi:uncharacterized SAM-binding protein YcdF (DUF218 family)|uniref:YdcF family protein n=1 Tax=Thiohalocapsa sp. ML1 TaxID=1431688 RepID=UPI00073230C3|nr:YdcF family protein [Thiohalocapsa sp. ML1]
MEAYPLIKQLLLPPGLLLLLLAVAFLLVRGTLGRVVLFIAWSLLLAMSLPALSGLLMQAVETYPPLPPAMLDDTRAEAIVVLGAGVYSDAPEYGGHTVDLNSMKRSRYAAWLHRRTRLPIYVSGGVGPRAPGPPMRRFLEQELGVPVAAVEEQSGNTRENAELTAPLLAKAGIGRVLLVTDAWHMPRAVAAFERVGVDVVAAPTYFLSGAHRLRNGAEEADDWRDWLPQMAAFTASFYAIHELLGGAYYQLRATVAGPPSPLVGVAR